MYGLRWWIIGLVFLGTVINFVGRLTIAVLAPVITVQLGLTNLQFASISTWFLVAYTASQGFSGRLYDRVGTRRGFSLSILLWSSLQPLRYLSVDCFVGGRPKEEPTWESHVRVMCAQNGWDFDRIRGDQ